MQETLSITDRAYLMFEGKLLKAGTAEELAADEQVRKVYLGQHFELKRKNLMAFINSILTWVMKKRMHQIELFIKYPLEVQEELFKRLITTARNTEFGRTHGFADVHTPEQFRKLIPSFLL